MTILQRFELEIDNWRRRKLIKFRGYVGGLIEALECEIVAGVRKSA